MAKIASHTLEALARIRFSEKQLVDWVRERRDEYREKLELQTDDVQLRILQGRAQELTSILDLIEQAPELLRKA